MAVLFDAKRDPQNEEGGPFLGTASMVWMLESQFDGDQEVLRS
jgi:hypothetical protein